MEQPHARSRQTALVHWRRASDRTSPCISDRPHSRRYDNGRLCRPDLTQVKPNSIWFDESAQLTHWQELKKSGNAAALTSYEQQMLGQRNAWQFLKPLKVKILRYEPATSQVNVEMKTAGRLQGTTWWLDASAVGR